MITLTGGLTGSDHSEAGGTTRCGESAGGRTGACGHAPERYRLAADAELCDNCLVARHFDFFEVIEQRATLGHHFQKAATRMVVFRMGFEMACQVCNPFGEDGNLHFRRTGITGLCGIFFDKRGFALCSNRPRMFLLIGGSAGFRLCRLAVPGCRPGRSGCPDRENPIQRANPIHRFAQKAKLLFGGCQRLNTRCGTNSPRSTMPMASTVPSQVV